MVGCRERWGGGGRQRGKGRFMERVSRVDYVSGVTLKLSERERGSERQRARERARE